MRNVLPAEWASRRVSGPFSQTFVVKVMEFAALQHSDLLVELIIHQANLALMISLDHLAERLTVKSPPYFE